MANLFYKIGDQFKNDKCGLSPFEMQSIMRMVLHEEWNLNQISRHFNVSVRTIERWCEEGKLPPLQKEAGGKKFLWHDEIELWIIEHGDPDGRHASTYD